MRSIGLRVTPKEVFYSIIEKDDKKEEILSISSIKVPKALDEPQQLENIRSLLITIIDQYKINRGAIKVIESNNASRLSDSIIFRLNIEGIIKEVFASSSIEKYLLGRATNVSAVFGIKCKKVLDLVSDLDMNLDTRTTDKGSKVTDNYKEAIVVALAVLRKE